MTFGLDSLRLSVHVTYIGSRVVHRLNTSWSHHQAAASPANSATAAGAGAPLETDGLSRYGGLAASSGARVGTILQNDGARGGPVGGCGAGAKVLDAACELIRGFGHDCRLEEGGGHCVCQRERIRSGGSGILTAILNVNEGRWDKGSGVSGGQVRVFEKGGVSAQGGEGATHCSSVQGWRSKQKEEEENSRRPIIADISERNKSRSTPHDVFLIIFSSPPFSSLLPHILSPPRTLRLLPLSTSLAAGCTTVYHACIHPPALFCPYFPSPSLLPLGGLRGPAAIAPAFATFPDHCRHSTKNLNLIGGRAASYERPTSAFTFLLDVVPL